MDRQEAIRRIAELKGQDLRPLADRYGVTVWWPEGQENARWANQVIERHLGMALNSSRETVYGPWLFKVVRLKRLQSGLLAIQGKVMISTLDSVEIQAKDFERSFLYRALHGTIFVSRICEDSQESSSVLHTVTQFDLDNPEIYQQVKADYNLIRHIVLTQGVASLTSRVGILLQPRRNPVGRLVSHSFYATRRFLAMTLGVSPPEL